MLEHARIRTGLSKLVLPKEIMHMPCGTLSYVAPEVRYGMISCRVMTYRVVSHHITPRPITSHRPTSHHITPPSPQVLSLRGYGKEADLWSVGVIMFLLLRGKLPFNGKTKDDIVVLGAGSFGTVFKARDKKNPKFEVAIKCIKK